MKTGIFFAVLLFSCSSAMAVLSDDASIPGTLPETAAYNATLNTTMVTYHNTPCGWQSGAPPTDAACAAAAQAVWKASITAANAKCFQVAGMTFDAGIAAHTAALTNGTECKPAPIVVATLPSRPLNVVAVAGNGTATVSFSPSLSDGGSPITLYKAMSTASANNHLYGTGSPITVPGLINGTAYTFTVQAQNAVGLGPASAASNTVTPGP